MNNEGNICVHKMYLFMAYPRTFTNLILPLLIQSSRIIYYVDKITAVFGFQRVIGFSVYGVSESVIQKF